MALVRNESRARARFAHYEGRDDLTFLIQDASRPLDITERVDVIIHAASNASPKFYVTGHVVAGYQGSWRVRRLSASNMVMPCLAAVAV